MLTSIIHRISLSIQKKKKKKKEKKERIPFLTSRIANQVYIRRSSISKPSFQPFPSLPFPREESISPRRSFQQQDSKRSEREKEQEGKRDLTRVPVSGGKREQGLK